MFTNVLSTDSSVDHLAVGLLGGVIHLETRNLTRVVGSRTLVDNVSVVVEPGEIMAITGPSGAGKSSFLRMLNRLDEPSNGMVLFQGQDFRSVTPSLLRRAVGMVMQNANLFPGTVTDNLSYGPAQHNEEIEQGYIEQLLEEVGLPGYASHDVSTLSGGEAQRVSIARTLANRPLMTLLGEPTSALDEKTGREVEELILGISAQRKMTCLIVTHNPEQARRIAKRTMYMVAGKLIEIGPSEVVLNAHRSV